MKKLLSKVSVAFLFIVLVSGSQTAFANVNFWENNNNSWETNFQTGVSLRSFRAMKNGMSLNKVNAIIGFEGTRMSLNEGGGRIFTSYKWEGRNYAIITAVFDDYRLTNKYQANLK